MPTMLTEDAMLAALAKWGLKPKFYRDDWRSHDRDKQQGWGPIYGFIPHNFGSDNTDANALNYLYTGDLDRGMPGPLSQFAITDDGQLWVIGWGTANHTGSIGQELLDLVKKDAAPLDRDYRPSTTFSDRTGVLSINDNFIGCEMTYGKAPTPAQRTTLVRLGAAMMDALGDGYTGGSVVGHRECDTQRSDPVGIPMWQLRRDINALLKAGPTGSGPTSTVQEDDMAYTPEELARAVWTNGSADIIPAPKANLAADPSNPAWTPSSYLFYLYASLQDARGDIAKLTAAVTQIAGATGVQVDEKALADSLVASLTPQVSEAVKAAVAAAAPGATPDEVAAAVVAQLGTKLAS